MGHADTGTWRQQDLGILGHAVTGTWGQRDLGTLGHTDTAHGRPAPSRRGRAEGRGRACARGGAAQGARGKAAARLGPWEGTAPCEAQQAGVPSPCALTAAMEVSHSVKERTIAENSLVILLQGLRGRVTTVELRDESAAAGRVTSVDAFMNVRLAEVTFTDRQGAVSRLDELFVTGRNIRYVHIPDEVDIRATIEEQLQAIHRVRYFGARDKGRREFLPAKNK
uniref:LSM10, U7 small nuclear RNA associated n=1 Tax=Junco hyemalis TaxID=40217 RepID=A0A8C5INR1_JUNHY